MTARKLTPAEWLTLIADRAPALRTAGVTSLTLDGVSIELAPAPHEAPRELLAEEPQHLDPLDDPMTFGGAMPQWHSHDEAES